MSQSAGSLTGKPSTQKDRARNLIVVRPTRDASGLPHESFQALNRRTTAVYLTQFPFLWAVRLILERCPHLRVIQFPSYTLRTLGNTHRELLNLRGVCIRFKCFFSEVRRVFGRQGTRRRYEIERQRFLALLADPQIKKEFDELLKFDQLAAKVCARYFCLNGEKRATCLELTKEFGFSNHPSHINSLVRAVVFYFDPKVKVSKDARNKANGMRKRMAFFRKRDQQKAEKRAFRKHLKTLGIKTLPARMPLAEYARYEAVLLARRNGRLEKLHYFSRGRKNYPLAHKALLLRYGLDAPNQAPYRKLEEVGALIGGVTRERARQHIRLALDFLNIR